MASPEWWRSAVCYQIYPRSFMDVNGDGHGDLPGILSRLDYLEWLGIDALWISPFYPSPNFDWGYDVADYTSVDPVFGNLADFDELLVEAHRRGIRILLDLVLNHTSNRHSWFQQSSSSRDNPYRNWYIWRDGRDGGPPNDWEALFGGSAWQFDSGSGQYYYHFFFPQQPDLNWRNPEVKQAVFDVMRFWFDRGVDGFRLDAIAHIFEREDLADCDVPDSLETLFVQVRRGLFDDGADRIRHKIRHQQHLPETHVLMKEMRLLADCYPDRVLLGEVKDIEYYGSGRDELHSVFNFDMIQPDLDAKQLRGILSKRLCDLPPGAWDCSTVGNHDRGRSFTVFGDGRHNEQRACIALALAMFFYGTPVIYYGEEIGMQSLPPEKPEDFRDGLAIWAYNAMRGQPEIDEQTAFEIAARQVCRDASRTPMQWDATENAGFSPSGVETWLPIHSNHADGVSVEAQLDNPDSMLRFFRRLIDLRRENHALKLGEMHLVEDTGQALVFLRGAQDQRCMVALNLGTAQTPLPYEAAGFETIFSSVAAGAHPDVLGPYEIRVGRSASHPE